MIQNFVNQFRATTLNPAIMARLQAMLDVGVAAAREGCPKDTGYLESTIGGTIDQKNFAVILHADADYALHQELGTRFIKAHPFLRPAIAVMGKAWGGLARIGIHAGAPSLAVSAPNHAEKYHDRTLKYTKGKIGRARLKVGHGRYR